MEIQSMPGLKNIPLRWFALFAGFTILAMAIIAPFAELYAYPKLVVPGNGAETSKNIVANKSLFISVLFSYLFTFIGDVLLSWALYFLLKQVNRYLSLLAACFRLVFAMIALNALVNLITVFRLLNTSEYVTIFEPDQLNAQVMLCLNTFRSSYHFGILFFGIHLIITGYLVFKSDYIPKVLGLCLILSGLGYLADSLKPFLFPNFNTGFITITFFGELIFMLWLLIKGSRLKESNQMS